MAPLGLEQNVHVPSNFLAKIHPTPDLSILSIWLYLQSEKDRFQSFNERSA